VDIIQDSHGRKKFPIADLLRTEGNGPRQGQRSSLDNADNSATLIHQDHITTILRKIKSLAESYLHEPVEHAVITVPVSYGDLERQTTRDAAHRAGLTVLRLLNTPTAAGIAQWVDRPRNSLMLVLDVAASRADATLLEVSDGLFEIKCSGTDAWLDGRSYDLRLLDHLRPEIRGRDHDPALAACERLQASPSVPESVSHDSFNNTDYFDSMCSDIVKSIKALISQVLKDGNLEISDVREVVMVGDSELLLRFHGIIVQIFERSPDGIWCPHMACARGAAIQAASLFSPSFCYDLLVLDIVPSATYLELHAGCLVQIWPRNAVLTRQSTIRVQVPSHLSLPRNLQLLEGQFGSRKVVGAFDLTPLYTLFAPGRGLEIELTAAVDLDGVLDASLVCADSDSHSETTIILKKSPFPGLESQHPQRTQTGTDNGRPKGSVRSYVTSLKSLSRTLMPQQQKILENVVAQVENQLRDRQDRNKVEDQLALEQMIRYSSTKQRCQ
jgi:L1 cell adhesion molecule like protein